MFPAGGEERTAWGLTARLWAFRNNQNSSEASPNWRPLTVKKPMKSKSFSHGGKRENAGRRPKPRAPAIPLRILKSELTAEQLAKAHLALAIQTLASVAGAGASEAARVSAARAIIETATGKVKAAQGTTEQRHDDGDGWDGLLDQRPRGHVN
jgi:hypothetical protein